MAKKFKTGMIVILLLICGLTFLYFQSKKFVSDENIVVASGNLSTNYFEGNSVTGKKNDYSFSISNNSDKASSFDLDLSLMRNYQDDMQFIVYQDDKEINKGKILKEISMLTSVNIEPKETLNYKVKFEFNNNKSFKAILKVDELKGSSVTFADVIKENNSISNTTLTDISNEISTENEGLISDYDDFGVTYYFRGNVNNNYLSFGDLIWRIVRVNGDNTVRVVLDSITDTVQAYNVSTEGEFNKYEASTIDIYLKDWYNQNLIEYDGYIASSSYCNDYSFSDSENYQYNGLNRLSVNHNPSFDCQSENVNAKIGLLSADEVVYAGASYKSQNTSYYLYNSGITTDWWTITNAKGSEKTLNPFIITVNGALEDGVAATFNRGVRPVINLNKKVSVTGKGTKEEPYVIVEN